MLNFGLSAVIAAVSWCGFLICSLQMVGYCLLHVLWILFFPLITAITLYLTFRLYGIFIVGFCLFWIIYFFARGYIPDWAGIFAGSEGTVGQSMRSMVLNFWAQTGGMLTQPIQVVSGNVLIFVIFGAVLTSSGAGSLVMKIANRLTGAFTGGAAHAAVASSALFGTLSGAAISNVVSTGVMTIPVIKKSDLSLHLQLLLRLLHQPVGRLCHL